MRVNEVRGGEGHGIAKYLGYLAISGSIHPKRSSQTPTNCPHEQVRVNEVWGGEGHGIHVCRDASGVFDANQVCV